MLKMNVHFIIGAELDGNVWCKGRKEGRLAIRNKKTEIAVKGNSNNPIFRQSCLYKGQSNNSNKNKRNKLTTRK